MISDTTIKYSNALNDWAHREMPLQQFLHEQQLNWGKPHFNRCETMSGDDVVRIYTDRDCYLDKEPTPQQCEQQYQECRSRMIALC